MTVKTIRLLAVALAAAVFGACQKDPSTSDLHRDYLVYTAYDTKVDFAGFQSFFIPDRILIIGRDDKEAVYWEDDKALEIIGAIVSELTSRGYMRTAEKEQADLGMQLSYVERATYFVGNDYPYWWWYYPYYWSPGYWGDYWAGWYYPYRVYYGYTAGSLLVEMLDLDEQDASDKKIPVIWNSFIGGLLTSDARLDQRRLLAAVGQAFEQSPYLHR